MSTHNTRRIETAAPAAPLIWHDLRLALAGALLLMVLVIFDPWLWFLAPLRLFLGFLYVLYVPGYCLQVALFPRKYDLDGIERVGLSFGLSVALVSLLALILSWLPWGIFLWPMLLGQLAFLVLFTSIALVRRMRIPVDERYAPAPTFHPRSWWQSLRPLEQRIYQVILVSGLLLLFALVWFFTVPSSEEFLTEFYILGAEGQAESYPYEPVVGEEIDVLMGIVNQERGPETYYVEVWVTWAWEPEEWWTMVEETEPITLEPGEKMEQRITWAMPWEVDDAQVYFRLYRAGDATPYRELLLWMDVAPASEQVLPDAEQPDTAEIE